MSEGCGSGHDSNTSPQTPAFSSEKLFLRKPEDMFKRACAMVVQSSKSPEVLIKDIERVNFQKVVDNVAITEDSMILMHTSVANNCPQFEKGENSLRKQLGDDYATFVDLPLEEKPLIFCVLRGEMPDSIWSKFLANQEPVPTDDITQPIDQTEVEITNAESDWSEEPVNQIQKLAGRKFVEDNLSLIEVKASVNQPLSCGMEIVAEYGRRKGMVDFDDINRFELLFDVMRKAEHLARLKDGVNPRSDVLIPVTDELLEVIRYGGETATPHRRRTLFAANLAGHIDEIYFIANPRVIDIVGKTTFQARDGFLYQLVDMFGGTDASEIDPRQRVKLVTPDGLHIAVATVHNAVEKMGRKMFSLIWHFFSDLHSVLLKARNQALMIGLHKIEAMKTQMHQLEFSSRKELADKQREIEIKNKQIEKKDEEIKEKEKNIHLVTLQKEKAEIKQEMADVKREKAELLTQMALRQSNPGLANTFMRVFVYKTQVYKISGLGEAGARKFAKQFPYFKAVAKFYNIPHPDRFFNNHLKKSVKLVPHRDCFWSEEVYNRAGNKHRPMPEIWRSEEDSVQTKKALVALLIKKCHETAKWSQVREEQCRKRDYDDANCFHLLYEGPRSVIALYEKNNS